MLKGKTLATPPLVGERADGDHPTLRGRMTKSVMWTVLAEWIPRAAMIGTNLYLVRILTPAEFGVLALAQATVQFLWGGVDLGSSLYGAREVARTTEHAAVLLGSLLTLRLTVCAVVVGVYWVGVALFADADARLVMLAAGFFLPSYGLMTDWMLRGLERMDLAAIANGLGALAMVACLVALVHEPDADVKAALVWASSYAVTATISLMLANRELGISYRPNFSPKTWIYHLRRSTLMSLATFLAAGTYQLVISVLAIKWSSQEVARLAGPYRLVLAVGTASLVLPLAAYPVLSSLASTKYRFAELSSRLMGVMLLIVAPCALLGAANAALLVRLLLGEQYSSAAIVFSTLSLLLPGQCGAYVLETSLLAYGAERARALASICAFGVSAVSAVILVPLLGALGASLSLVLGTLVSAVALGYFHVRVIGQIAPLVATTARIIPPSIILAILLPWGAADPDWMRLSIALTAFLVAATLTGALPLRELYALLNPHPSITMVKP